MSRLVFENIPIIESGEPLVDVKNYPFATEAVYYQKGYSTDHRTQLRKGIADMLLHIQGGFDGKYRFKIWDGYRPRTVQDAIYNAYYAEISNAHPDWPKTQIHEQTETFVTRASELTRIPPHATGAAIDLTLLDINDRELDMGTAFDAFSPEAATMFYEENTLNIKIRNNRRILRNAMTDAGFRADDDEWWHFDYGNQIWASVLGHDHAIYGEV